MGASRKPSVLLIVSSDSDFARYAGILGGSFRVERLAHGSDALIAIQRAHADVVVLDYEDESLPPLRLAYQLRVHPNHRTYTALICISDAAERPAGREAPGVEVLCTRTQAHERLRALVKNALRIKATMMEELGAANHKHGEAVAGALQRVKRLTLTDGLTGLYNMNFMYRMVQSEFLRAERYQKNLALVLVDIDHFRQFSQGLTAPQSAHVISLIGQEIGDCVRFEVDYAARADFDSFLLVLPETRLEGAMIVAERLRQRVSKLRFPDVAALGQLTASIGVVHYDGLQTELRRSQDLLRLLEECLQKAKREGRNRIAGPMSASPIALPPSA